MERNIGNADRAVRYIIGVIIILAGIYFKSWWGLIGVLPLLTGTIRYCPLYVPFKLNTGAPKS